jgi:hypothetical protein
VYPPPAVPVPQAFLSAAGGYDDVVFGISTLKEVAAEFGVSGNAVVLFKKFDEGRAGAFPLCVACVCVACVLRGVVGHSLPVFRASAGRPRSWRPPAVTATRLLACGLRAQTSPVISTLTRSCRSWAPTRCPWWWPSPRR